MTALAVRPDVKGSQISSSIEAASRASVYSLNTFTEDYLPGAASLEVVGCGLTTTMPWKTDIG